MAKPKATSIDINSTYPDLLTKSYISGISSSGGLTIDTTSYNEYREFVDYCLYGKKEELMNIEHDEKEQVIDHKFLEGFEHIMKKDTTMREKAAQLVDKVLVHGPALIVFWKDGSKTVVKCTNEEFDLEKGVAMAFIKRVFGNKGNYNAFLTFIIDMWTF